MHAVSYPRSPWSIVHLTDEMLQDVCASFRQRFERVFSENPKVSVVFPAFNEEQYLLPMLEALSKIASIHPVEFIGVDNGSVDRTGEIIRESGIRCIHESTKWVSYARQSGLMEARGEFVFTTDADTLVPETWIDASLWYFSQNPALVGFTGGSMAVGSHWSYKVLRFASRTLRAISGGSNTPPVNFPGHNSVLKREVAMSIGGYAPGVDLGEDNMIIRKMWTQGETLCVCDDPSVRVMTSARRMGTFPRVVRMTVDRIDQALLCSRDDRRLTFADVR